MNILPSIVCARLNGRCLGAITKSLWLVLLLALPATVQAQFNYTNNNGAITITRYTGTNAEVMVPSTIDNLPVTSIADAAFASTPVTSVLIPEGVTNIGSQAFLPSPLASVVVPDSMMSIGAQAFMECPLTEAILGNTALTAIEDSVFQQCAGLTNVTLPNTVTSIGSYAFASCAFTVIDRKSVG